MEGKSTDSITSSVLFGFRNRPAALANVEPRKIIADDKFSHSGMVRIHH